MNYTIRGSLAGCCTEVGGSRWTSLLDESSRNGSQVHSSNVFTHPPQYRMSMIIIESCPHLGQFILSLSNHNGREGSPEGFQALEEQQGH